MYKLNIQCIIIIDGKRSLRVFEKAFIVIPLPGH